MSLFSAIPIATIPSGLSSDQGLENTLPIKSMFSFGAIFASARDDSLSMFICQTTKCLQLQMIIKASNDVTLMRIGCIHDMVQRD